MIYDKADFKQTSNIINKESMKASGVFCDDLFYYKCHKINLSHGGSYVDCSYLIKEKQQ